MDSRELGCFELTRLISGVLGWVGGSGRHLTKTLDSSIIMASIVLPSVGGSMPLSINLQAARIGPDFRELRPRQNLDPLNTDL